MDVLDDDVTELDGPLLAALWARAVLAADPVMIVRVETECERRGVTAGALVAATKKEKDSGMVQTVGERRSGPHDYQDIVTQSQKNIAEGKSYETGQATYKTKGYNPYRVPKGKKGGGRFTTKEGTAAETTDPDKARPGAELEEDDPRIPKKSPGGADIDDFRDGMMIYEDGTRFDAKGWRNAKGEALDAEGNVIRKPKKGKAKAKGKGGGSAEAAKKKLAYDAEVVRKQAAQQQSTAWDTAEGRRKAQADADNGNYGPLLGILTRAEAAARKKRDLSTAPDQKAQNDADVAAAQKELAAAQAAADKAKAAQKQAAIDKANTDAQAKVKAQADAQTAAQKAQYAAISANYPAWEQALREEYADVGLTETELQELIIRDRARRVRMLPRNYGQPGGPSGPVA